MFKPRDVTSGGSLFRLLVDKNGVKKAGVRPWGILTTRLG